MRTIHKARLVPDTAPDGLTTKVIKVEDLGVPVAAALGRWEALTDEELSETWQAAEDEMVRRYGV
jgi:hypothetical protein